MRTLSWCGVLLLILLGAGCASRPAPSVQSDASATAESPSPGSEAGPPAEAGSPGGPAQGGYDLSREGEAPVTGDVEFEEDRLPPAPEEVGADTLEKSEVVAQEVEEMPPVQGERIEPSVTAPVEPSVETPVAGHRATMSRGFRVQIAASSDKSKAEEVARVARTRVPEAVHVVFESPYYKVRVGDFHDRAAALQLRDRLRAYGYDQAWVVTTEVQAAPKDSQP